MPRKVLSSLAARNREAYPPHKDCGGRLIYTGGGWVVCAKCREAIHFGRIQGKGKK